MPPFPQISFGKAPFQKAPALNVSGFVVAALNCIAYLWSPTDSFPEALVLSSQPEFTFTPQISKSCLSEAIY
jgi:hypothetical protein